MKNFTRNHQAKPTKMRKVYSSPRQSARLPVFSKKWQEAHWISRLVAAAHINWRCLFGPAFIWRITEYYTNDNNDKNSRNKEITNFRAPFKSPNVLEISRARVCISPSERLQNTRPSTLYPRQKDRLVTLAFEWLKYTFFGTKEDRLE